MPRYLLKVEYDGTPYYGWQAQDGLPTAQGALETAIAKFCGGVQATVFCAGRTDAGVHATAQMVHVDLPKSYPMHNIIMGINFYLQDESVVVVDAREVPEEFHARFSAKGRAYVYRITNRIARVALDEKRAWHVSEELDTDAMDKAAKLLLGTHDFTSFRATECQGKTPIKTLDRLDVVRDGENIRIFAESRSFLHHQVRNMVGSLRLIGNGKWNEADMLRVLAAKDRTQAGETAPAHGLYFIGVKYDL
jgi:tRNA pseudouridine38-40 synthase